MSAVADRTGSRPVDRSRRVFGVFQAEQLKLRKRPAVWILLGVLLAVVALFGYLFGYVWAAGPDDIPGMDRDAVLTSLMPAGVVTTTLAQLAAFGLPIALILGALAVGSEYGWGTVKTIAVQGPGRSALVAGKLLALAVVLGLLVGATGAVAWVSSVAVAGVEGGSIALPPFGDVLGGLGAGWLMLAPYALLGAVLALVFRSTGLALGLGLVYVLVAENLLLTLPLGERATELFAQIGIGPNAFAISQAFGDPPAGAQMIAVAAPDVGQAVAVIASYLVVLTALAVWVFGRRPIT